MKNEWRRSVLGSHYLEIDFDKMQYEAVIGICGGGYDLTITLGNKKNDFYSRSYCKTLKQAKELEARIRLILMETYL